MLKLFLLFLSFGSIGGGIIRTAFQILKLNEEELFGGETLKESEKIFNEILNGKGLEQQNRVVLTNAALGIQCFDISKSFKQAFDEAKHALYSGAAKANFEKCISISKTSNIVTQ